MASQMIRIADKLEVLREKSIKLTAEIEELIKLQSLEAQRQISERNKSSTIGLDVVSKPKRGRPAKKMVADVQQKKRGRPAKKE